MVSWVQYVCMVITHSRVWINRVRLPIVWYVVIQFTFYTLEVITINTTSLYLSLVMLLRRDLHCPFISHQSVRGV